VADLRDRAAELGCLLEAHRGALPGGGLAAMLLAVEAARERLEAARGLVPGGRMPRARGSGALRRLGRRHRNGGAPAMADADRPPADRSAATPDDIAAELRRRRLSFAPAVSRASGGDVPPGDREEVYSAEPAGPSGPAKAAYRLLRGVRLCLAQTGGGDTPAGQEAAPLSYLAGLLSERVARLADTPR
jgi:hypothetical protein